MSDFPTTILGNTGKRITRLGLGGEGILRTFGRESEAVPLIQRAVELGITYFDCARAYAGSEEYYGLALGKSRKKIFLCSKTHDRSRKGSLRFLETTLRNMKTDHLDLWQFHDVRTKEDLHQASSIEGCFQAFDEAKKAGYVRFIGITGHYDPHILLEAMTLYPFDTILLPVNPCESHHLSFLDIVIPAARRHNLGIIGMKVLKPFVEWNGKTFTIEELLHFALSYADVVITGCSSIQELEENASVVKKFTPLPKEILGDYARRAKNIAGVMLYKKEIEKVR